MTTRVALVGQPNCGKSTLFNMLTGARQHVANYPGVTVDVKRGHFKHGGETFEVIDLPGAYSLTSYSMEETVTRDALLSGEVDVVVDVLDSSNLKQGLYLTLQLAEMGLPVIAALNMVDVAVGRGLKVDHTGLAELLGVTVVETVGNRLRGKTELLEALRKREWRLPRIRPVDYGELELAVAELTEALAKLGDLPFPPRWGAVKLLENDAQVVKLLNDRPDGVEVCRRAEALAQVFETEQDDSAAAQVGFCRHQTVSDILRRIQTKGKSGPSLTDRIDRVAVHRVFGPVLLVAVIYLLYYLSIDRGYKLTEYFSPLLRRVEFFASLILPQSGLLEEGLLRNLGMSVVVAINAVLNYVPIFLVLFACIAFLEDAGYMPRIAFILDRLLRRFGLQGQSTLPLILGGVFVGGCAVPGVMATRVIADQRARLATILVVPMMNCLAKVPLYTLLIGAFFMESSAAMMFFISTVTLFMALCAAKVLSLTVLRREPSAPFIMELPPYHLPTIRGMILRSVERTWIFVKKIGTVVAAVTVGIFFLTHFPGLGVDRTADYRAELDDATAKFRTSLAGTRFEPLVAGEDGMIDLADVMDLTRKASFAGMSKNGVLGWLSSGSPFVQIVDPAHGKDPDVKKVTRAWRAYSGMRSRIQKRMNDELLDGSALGRVGRALEPVTRWAGFDWKVNVSLLAALAAKESTVATLGMLYRPPEGESGGIASGLKDEAGYTPLHALALMIFMALYPPCLAALIMVKMESGGWKWVALSLVFPTVMGLAFASLVFSGGQALGLTGPQAALAFSGLVLAATFLLGAIRLDDGLLAPRAPDQR